jgi:DNA-binding NarL/FixJ family response regulator
MALPTTGPTRVRGPRREAAALLAQLTPREQQVFALLPRGCTNAEIAAELGIATGTAKIHVERILHKLGVSDRTQAAVRASECGLRG